MKRIIEKKKFFVQHKQWNNRINKIKYSLMWVVMKLKSNAELIWDIMIEE